MNERLEEFLKLDFGWWDGVDGRPYTLAELKTVDILLTEIEKTQIKCYIYPHPEGEISLEIDALLPNSISLTYNFEKDEIYAHNYNFNLRKSSRGKFKINQLAEVVNWIKKIKDGERI